MSSRAVIDHVIEAITPVSEAQALGVRYLVADARVIPPGIAQRLSRQSKAVFRSGNLIRYQLY